MRIVYFNHNVIGAGTYLRAYRLAREVARLGHDVTVVTTSETARVGVTRRSEDGVTIIEAPDLWRGSARTGWDPWNTVVRCVSTVTGPVDLVHAFDSRPAVIIPALHLRKRTGARLAMDWADWWGRGGTIVERETGMRRYLVEGVETWFEERFRKEANLTTTICRALATRAAALGVPPSQTHLLPNGCAELNVPARTEARSRLGIDNTTPVVLHLGAAFRRDLDLLLAAFQETRSQVGNAQLIFAGRLPVTLPNENGVRTLGRVSDEELSLWLGAANVCVLPLSDSIANRGRWPSKVNEYLAAGRAVAMTDVGDVPDWIRSHHCGAVGSANAQSFGAAIAQVLQANDVEQMERNALALSAGELSWATLAGQLELHYRGIAATQPVSPEVVLSA